MNTGRRDEAISHYSVSLSLNPVINVFTKRCKAYMTKGLWGDAIDDANKVCLHFRQIDNRSQRLLGNSARFIVFMGLREGVGGVGQSKPGRRGVERCLDNRQRGMRISHQDVLSN